MIYVIDAPCGAGKTSSAINMINETGSNKQFMYVTPFLPEIDRIKKSCPDIQFKDPDKHGSKLRGLHYDLGKGRNTITTHALFRRFSKLTEELIEAGNYTLILDEVANVVENIVLAEQDKEMLVEHGLITISEVDGKVSWAKKDYDRIGKFNEIRVSAESGNLYCYQKKFFLWTFPIEVFKSFKDVYILTYLFDAQIQKYYYDFYNVQFKRLYVEHTSDGYFLTEEKKEYSLNKYKELIKIVDDDKLNFIGEKKTALSKNNFLKNHGLRIVAKNNIYNFFKHIAKSKSRFNMWAVFDDFKREIAGKGYTKGYVAINARATNDYQHKTALAYIVNRFMRPEISNFFRDKGIKVDEELWALSELIQWLFRSAVRNNEKITIYIPSKRMRDLLIKWMNGGMI